MKIADLYTFWFYIKTALVVLFFIAFVLWQRIAGKRSSRQSQIHTLPETLPAAGFSIPLAYAYGGIKDQEPSPIIQYFRKPKLILFDDHFVYRFIFRRSARYQDLLEVNAGSHSGEHLLRFIFKDRRLVLSAILINQALHKQVVDFLNAKGVMVID